MQQTLCGNLPQQRVSAACSCRGFKGEDEDTLSSMLETPRALRKVPAPAAASTPIPKQIALSLSKDDIFPDESLKQEVDAPADVEQHSEQAVEEDGVRCLCACIRP